MSECVECREVITNPLCPLCLKKAVVQWLSEKDPSSIKEFHKAHRKMAHGSGPVRCIKCKKGMDTCAHCYSAAVLTWLRRNPILVSEVEEYLTYFNFELRPLGEGVG